jgi:hypothetical protein
MIQREKLSTDSERKKKAQSGGKMQMMQSENN